MASDGIPTFRRYRRSVCTGAWSKSLTPILHILPLFLLPAGESWLVGNARSDPEDRNWLQRVESNHFPQGYEPCELPVLYSAIALLFVVRHKASALGTASSLLSRRRHCADVCGSVRRVEILKRMEGKAEWTVQLIPVKLHGKVTSSSWEIRLPFLVLLYSYFLEHTRW